MHQITSDKMPAEDDKDEHLSVLLFACTPKISDVRLPVHCILVHDLRYTYSEIVYRYLEDDLDNRQLRVLTRLLVDSNRLVDPSIPLHSLKRTFPVPQLAKSICLMMPDVDKSTGEVIEVPRVRRLAVERIYGDDHMNRDLFKAKYSHDGRWIRRSMQVREVVAARADVQNDESMRALSGIDGAPRTESTEPSRSGAPTIGCCLPAVEPIIRAID